MAARLDFMLLSPPTVEIIIHVIPKVSAATFLNKAATVRFRIRLVPTGVSEKLNLSPACGQTQCLWSALTPGRRPFPLDLLPWTLYNRGLDLTARAKRQICPGNFLHRIQPVILSLARLEKEPRISERFPPDFRPESGAVPYCSLFSFLFSLGRSFLRNRQSLLHSWDSLCSFFSRLTPLSLPPLPPALRCAQAFLHCCSWLSSATIFHQNTKPQWSIQAQARSAAAPPSHPTLL